MAELTQVVEARTIEGMRCIRFIPHEFAYADNLKKMGCGATVTALLTGRPAKGAGPIGKDWWDDHMIATLVKEGFNVVKVPPLYDGLNEFRKENVLKLDHVLLLRIAMGSAEDSWVVVYDTKMWHNLAREPVDEYTFVQYSVVSKYVISHPSWLPRYLKKEEEED